MSENKGKELTKQERLEKQIADGVDLVLKKKAAETSLKCHIDALCEEHGESSKYIRKLIDMKYADMYDCNKFDQECEFYEKVASFFNGDGPSVETDQESEDTEQK